MQSWLIERGGGERQKLQWPMLLMIVVIGFCMWFDRVPPIDVDVAMLFRKRQQLLLILFPLMLLMVLLLCPATRMSVSSFAWPSITTFTGGTTPHADGEKHGQLACQICELFCSAAGNRTTSMARPGGYGIGQILQIGEIHTYIYTYI